MKTQEEKAAALEARRAAKKAIKENERIEAEKNQSPVKSITINIEWKKSRTWGSNPHAEAVVYYQDGKGERKNGYTCGGCGYDKESTVIAEIFNDFLKYKLWSINITPNSNNNGGNISDIAKNKIPYGVVCYSENNPHYSGGIGTNCYYAISEFIGGKFEKIASGKTFDCFKYSEE